MSISLSALEGHIQPGKPAGGRKPAISIQEIEGLGLTQLAFFADQDPAMARWLKDRLKAGLPGPGAVAALRTGWVLRPEPGKIWLLGKKGQMALRAGQPAEFYPLDLSHSRSWLFIQGEKSVELLRRCVAIDLSDRGLASPGFAATGFHHVPVHLLKLPEGWLLGLPRSYALSLYELLCQTARPFGLQINPTCSWSMVKK